MLREYFLMGKNAIINIKPCNKINETEFIIDKRGLIMKIKEVIIVEGKNDTHRVKQAVIADTIETNGIGLSAETIRLIKHAYQKRGIIVLTDPDYAGNKIRKQVTAIAPDCKHAYIAKRYAQPDKKRSSVGVEHAPIEAIKQALSHAQVPKQGKEETITKSDLLEHGLIGTANAKERRELLGERLHIGYANGKQLLNRLRMFQISRNELKVAMMSILERGNGDD